MPPNSLWVAKLSSLVQKDFFLREAFLKRGILNDTYHPELEKLHLENAKKLKKLIDTEGFPLISNAGEEGVKLSWLIIQHAISWPEFMRECLFQMRLAAAEHDYSLELLAYTEDRIAFYEGRPQLYGTNLDWVDGQLKPTQIEDEKNIDQRRKAMGLPTLEKSLSLASEEKPPVDPDKKQKEFLSWLRRVGWRI